MNLYPGANAVAVADIDPERFAELRRYGIGGTDISAIAGINPWKSALTLYYEKTQGIFDAPESERMEWGKRLEPVIADAAAEKFNLTIEVVPCILAHPDRPYHRASIDRLIVDPEKGNGVLEVKNMGFWSAREVRKDAGENGIPDHYLLQLQWYLYVTGLQWGMFAALMEGSELRVEIVERDDELIRDLVRLADDFWACVENGTPPAADGSDSTSATLRRMFPEPVPEKVENLGPEHEELFAELLTTKAAMKPLKKREKELENAIKLLIGDAEAATCGPYAARFPVIERAGYAVEATKFRQLTVK